MRKTYVQDKETGEWVEVQRSRSSGHFVRGDVEPFVSPVDGSLIGSASQLREHNRRNGVVSMDDWGNQSEYVKREQEAAKKQDAQVRKEKLIHAVDQHRHNNFKTFNRYMEHQK